MHVKTKGQKRVSEKLKVHYQYVAVLQREHVVTVLLNLPQKEQAECAVSCSQKG